MQGGGCRGSEQGTRMTPPQINRCQIVYDVSSLSSLRSHTRDRYDNICKIFRDLYFTLAIVFVDDIIIVVVL